MKKATKKTAVKIGAGVAAAAAAVAAAGYYFYGSKNAKNHRKIAAKWAGEMKGQVVKEAKMLKKASPAVFAAVVDKVAKGYKHIDAIDLKRAANELKMNWNLLQKEVGGKKAVKKTVKKVAKKVMKSKKR